MPLSALAKAVMPALHLCPRAQRNQVAAATTRKAAIRATMQYCPNWGAGELKIIAAILEWPVIEKILTHLGLDPPPPPRGGAREAGQDFAT
jgi:hypothetical protein